MNKVINPPVAMPVHTAVNNSHASPKHLPTLLLPLDPLHMSLNGILKLSDHATYTFQSSILSPDNRNSSVTIECAIVVYNF